MNSNSPQTLLSGPKSQETPALSVSEAMRRMGDLLKSKKLSASDNVIFEYNNFTFTAHILPDGSLRSKTQNPSAEPKNITPLPIKLFSSPSEFASDMAARAIQLGEKPAKPRGKIAINGWNNCNVNGRSLATIRNEMLHERKHENTNVTVPKESSKEPPCTSVQSPRSDPESREEPISAHGLKEDISAQHKQPSQHSPKEDDLKHLTNEQEPPVAKNGSELPTDKEKKDDGEGPEPKLSGEGNESSVPEMEPSCGGAVTSQAQLDRSNPEVDQAISSGHDKSQNSTENEGDGKQERTPAIERNPTDELVVENVPARIKDESAGSMETPEPKGKLLGAQETNPKTSESQKDPEPTQQDDMNKVESERLKPAKVTSQSDPKPSEQNVEISGEAEGLIIEKNQDKDSKAIKEADETAIPSSGSIVQPKESKSQDLEMTSGKPEGGKDQGEAKSDSTSKNEDDQKEDEGNTREMSYDGDIMEDVRYTQEASERTEKVHHSDDKRAKPISSPTGSVKEVPDLQQEILGDSDSDEESSAEHERKPDSVLKKRSRSLLTHVQRKRMRTDESGSPEFAGESEMQTLNQKDSTDGKGSGPVEETTTKTEIEGTQLDPETMEVAAIAAQLDKEEANNRARKNTRLAAGKIKQVDYKAAAIAPAPPSSSLGQDSEDIDRNSNDNGSPTETTRTTRRRTTPNQWYPSQRSSRRVAKLRSGHEKGLSSNDDEIDHHALRSSSDGNATESRSGKESADGDETGTLRGNGSRPTGGRTDGNDRRRGRLDASGKRTRHAYYEEGDHDSQGRAYSTRASTRETSVVDAAEIAALADSADFLSEDEDTEDDEAVETRTNIYGFTAKELRFICSGVDSCGSAETAAVREAVKDQRNVTTEDTRLQKLEEFIRESKESMQNLSKSISSASTEVTRDQLLSFLSAEQWRLKTGGLNTGIPRTPTRIFKRSAREEQVRLTLERSRKKEHRDVEEMRGNLEKEMESRRRAELDTLCIEIQVSEATRALAREKARCDRVDRETVKYKDMEMDIRRRLEKAKILVGQLRGEKDDADGANGNVKRGLHQDETMTIERCSNGGFASSPVRNSRNSAASDDDVEMNDKNITTTSQRLLEMDRLRVLIASREAEAEDYQRTCERERMRFANGLELKNRLETEIYLYKSHSASVHGTGNASSLPVSSRIGKDSVKKSDHRGPSSHGSRLAGNAKQKSGVGRNVAAVLAVANAKNHASTSRSKGGPGKSGDGPKTVKRKPIARNGGHGSDKGYARDR